MAEQQIIGYDVKDLASSLDIMEQAVEPGDWCKVEFCTLALPTQDALDTLYLGLAQSGHTITQPVAEIIDGVPTASFNIQKELPYEIYQWQFLVPLILPILAGGLVVFGITQLKNIVNTLMPVLIIGGALAMGLVIVLAKPAERVATAYIQSPKQKLLPKTTQRFLPSTIPNEMVAETHERPYFKTNPPSPLVEDGLTYGIHNQFPTRKEADEEVSGLKQSGDHQKGDKYIIKPWEGGYVIYAHYANQLRPDNRHFYTKEEIGEVYDGMKLVGDDFLKSHNKGETPFIVAAIKEAEEYLKIFGVSTLIKDNRTNTIDRAYEILRGTGYQSATQNANQFHPDTEKLGTIWTARAKLYDKNRQVIASCVDTPNAIAKAFMETPDAQFVTLYLGESEMRPRDYYKERMKDWNKAPSGLHKRLEYFDAATIKDNDPDYEVVEMFCQKCRKQIPAPGSFRSDASLRMYFITGKCQDCQDAEAMDSLKKRKDWQPATNPLKPNRNQVKVEVWEERDRLHIGIQDNETGHSYADWWDDDARQMFEDGFFKNGIIHRNLDQIADANLTKSVLDYAEEMGILAGGKNLKADVYPPLNAEERYHEPTDVGNAIEQSMTEEEDAALYYKKRAKYALSQNPPDKKAAELFNHIAEEECCGPKSHHAELAQRLSQTPKREFVADSSEYLASTIAELGFREKLDTAFMEATERLKK